MTYKIAICDDSQADRDYVASLVRRWASEGDRTAHIEAFSSAEGFLFTGYSDYIAEGYEVAALHYLMKPLDENKLFSVLNRAAEKLQKNEKVLHLELSGEMVRLPVHRIRWAEVSGNYVTIHENGDYTVKMTLGQLEKELDERFFRVGRSAIVNLTQISRVTKRSIMLSGGASVPLPRGAYEAVNRAIIQMR